MKWLFALMGLGLCASFYVMSRCNEIPSDEHLSDWEEHFKRKGGGS